MDVDLMVLQERCRKDPLSYRDDFLTQRRHFDALLTSTSLRPSAPSARLSEVASFMGAVAHCYPPDQDPIAPPVAALLTQSGPAMHPDTRRALVKLLALLRARGGAPPAIVIPLFFRLLACRDKGLRRMLHGHIVGDVRRLGGGGGGRELQGFLFGMVANRDEVLVKRTLRVLVDLFRKRIWNDARCANMIAEACFHDSMAVALIATRFMLDSESKADDIDSDEEEDEGESVRSGKDGQRAADMWKAYNMTGKKTSKKRKRMERIINRMTRTKKGEGGAVVEVKPGHPALEAMMLLNDPQEFAEKLFRDLQTRRKKESFENRLVFINLISRLVGTHELIMFNFYPFLQRYLQPAQVEVTRVLAYLTQACHDMVPPDVLHPILRGLADSFVSDRSSPPSVAAGLNTIRAICSRVPLAILDENNENKPEEEQESPLLEDLVQYKASKDKGIVMAARSLIALYREVHPGLLQKKDRGRAGAVAVQKGQASHARAYGELQYATGVDGIELLAGKDSDEESEGEDEEGWQLSDAEDDGASGQVGGGEEWNDDDDDVVDDDSEGEGEGEGEGAELSAGTLQSAGVDSGKDEKADADNGSGADGDVEVAEDEKRVDELKILSQEDFAKIRARRAAQDLSESGITTNTGAAVDPDALQGPIKKGRKTLAERMETVLEGRGGREKFGSKKGLKKGGGSTNKKKLKTKSNSMVIHKRRRRNKMMSHRERQMSKRKKRDYK